MSEDVSTLFDRYDIQISNTERRNSSISIQDCYIVYLIECRSTKPKFTDSYVNILIFLGQEHRSRRVKM